MGSMKVKNRFSSIVSMLGAVFVPTSFQGRIEFKKHPLTEQQIIHVTKIKSNDNIYEVPRLNISNSMSLTKFKLRMLWPF